MFLELQRFKLSFWLKPLFFCVKRTTINGENGNDFSGTTKDHYFSLYSYKPIFETVIKYIKVPLKDTIRNRST